MRKGLKGRGRTVIYRGDKGGTRRGVLSGGGKSNFHIKALRRRIYLGQHVQRKSLTLHAKISM